LVRAGEGAAPPGRCRTRWSEPVSGTAAAGLLPAF
jgi:hypothetical protein